MAPLDVVLVANSYALIMVALVAVLPVRTPDARGHENPVATGTVKRSVDQMRRGSPTSAADAGRPLASRIFTSEPSFWKAVTCSSMAADRSPFFGLISRLVCD